MGEWLESGSWALSTEVSVEMGSSDFILHLLDFEDEVL